MYSNNSGNGSSIDIEKKSKKSSNIELTGGIRKTNNSDSTPGEKRERSGSKRRKKDKSK